MMDKPIVELTGFNGLYTRGAYEACPPDHLTDCMNCIFPGPKQLTIRESVTQSTYVAGRTILSYFVAQMKAGTNLLTLNSNGNFYDETRGILLGTFTNADDFTAINIFGRTYLCFKSQGKPLYGSSLYYYDGVYFSSAAGPIPTGVLSLTTGPPKVATTITTAILPGAQIVVPASMTNITGGMSLTVANADGSNSEVVTVSSTGANYFIATFTLSKTGPGITIKGYSYTALINTTLQANPASGSGGVYSSGYNTLLPVSAINMAPGVGITITNSDGSNAENTSIALVIGSNPITFTATLASSKAAGATVTASTPSLIVNTEVSSVNYPTGTLSLPAADMSNIAPGISVTIANSNTSNSELVTVISVVTTTTPNYFTAVLTSTKSGPGVTVASSATVIPGPGTYQVSIAFQSPNGWLSPPLPVQSVAVSGTNSIVISNIPTVSNTVVNYTSWQRVILVSQANKTALFFLPNGTIADNTTTTVTINFYDTSLVASADYLYDVLPSLPAGSALRFYNGRLVIIGATNYYFQGNAVYAPDQVLLSDVSNPESFNAVTGNITFPVDYGSNTCSTGLVILSVLFIMKPNGTFSTQDNGGDPNTWSVSVVDSALGAWDNGISVFSSSAAAQDALDSAFVLTKRGLMLFQAGTYSPTVFTKKIESLWKLLDDALYISSYFYKSQVAHDVRAKRVYIAVPVVPPAYMGGFFTPGTNSLQTILMMDYQEGLSPDSVKWSTWTSQIFGSAGISKMSIENFTYGNSLIYQLSFCVGDAAIYKVVAPTVDNIISYTTPHAADGTYPINQYIVTAPIDPPGGGVYTWNMLNLGITGYGQLNLSLFNRNRSYLASINTTIALAIAAGSQTVTPGSMSNITTSTRMLISDGVHSEFITPSAVGATTFTATFIYSYNAGAAITANIPVSLKGFNLSSYASSPVGQMELQRLINFVAEGIQVGLQCDLSIPRGSNGFFLLTLIGIYGRPQWGMRPALVQST